MTDRILQSFNIWTDARGEKHKGRVRSMENISLEGIVRLRELILELAVRGKLVPQDPNDGPASELLNEVAEEARLVKEGKIKKEKLLPEIKEVEKPFTLPKGWEWCQLGDIGSTNVGLTYKPTEISTEGIPVLRSSNIQEGKLSLNELVRVTTKYGDKDLIRNGDLLICARNGSAKLVGKCALIEGIEEEMTFGAFMAIFRSKFNPYIRIFIESPLYRSQLEGVETTTINQITQSNLKSTLIPLPPLNEQKRIVAKVEELMTLCGKLEDIQTRNLHTHQQLVTTLLHTLTQAKDTDELHEAWQRMALHFDTLFCIEDSIEQLKQTILQLAVMGRLVEQNPSDEPASKLLEKIAAEKIKLVEEGKIKKEKPLPEIKEEEKPFELPKGWEWVRLGDISANIHYGYNASANHEIEGVRLLRITDIQDDEVDWESVPGTHIDGDKSLDYLLEDGDILIARTGGTIGKSYLVSNIAVKSIFASYLIRVQKLSSTYPEYIKFYLKSATYWSQLYASSMGTGQPNVNGTALKSLKVPLPPLEEQKRIVAKVDELFAICDELKARIIRNEETKVKLSVSIVQQAAL